MYIQKGKVYKSKYFGGQVVYALENCFSDDALVYVYSFNKLENIFFVANQLEEVQEELAEEYLQELA